MAKPSASSTSKLLLHEAPLQVLPGLAVALGLNAAIILQQLHYWLRRQSHTRDGQEWYYNTYEDWKRQFPFWSVSTIKRAMLHLQEHGIVIAANYNNSPIDKTKWYAINYTKLNELCEPSTGQDEPSTGQDEPLHGSSCSHLFLETTTEKKKDNSLTTFESLSGSETAHGFSLDSPISPQPNAVPQKKTSRKKTPLAAEDWLAIWLQQQVILDIPFDFLNDDKWWGAASILVTDGFNEAWLEREFAKIVLHFQKPGESTPRTESGWKRFLTYWFQLADKIEQREKRQEKRYAATPQARR